MQTEICEGKKEQTSFVIHRGALASSNNATRSNTGTCNISRTILLPQKPEEKIDLQFSLSYSQAYNNYNGYYNYSFEYNFALTFKNNLHDMSNDYGYEIDFYQHVQDKDPSYHTLLFSEKHIRKTNKISIAQNSNLSNSESLPEFFQKLLVNTDERHFCCRMQRYNLNAAKNVNLQSTQNTDIGRMLFEKGLYSDVSLLVGEQRFRVHKDILSSASDYFKAMFSHDMIENKKNEVTIKDFDPEVVEELLSFIYTGETSLITKMSIELFQAAERYEMHSLKAQCMEYFLFIVNNKNVVDMLYNASMYNLTELKKNFMKYIEIHEAEMVKEESFQKFLCHDLNVDTVVYTLKLCDEYQASLNRVEMETFLFIKNNNKSVTSTGGFLQLFESHSSLMSRLYVFLHAND